MRQERRDRSEGTAGGSSGEATRLEDHLRKQVETVDGLKARLPAEHGGATKARRTATTWMSWRDEQVTRAVAFLGVVCPVGRDG
jgi:hypothetical protein